MKVKLIKISWIDGEGKKHEWITVGLYDDPKHPRRKYCFSEGTPCLTWFDDANTLEECIAWLWANKISVDAIMEQNVTVIVEKA
jgi:hypothetical protein